MKLNWVDIHDMRKAIKASVNDIFETNDFLSKGYEPRPMLSLNMTKIPAKFINEYISIEPEMDFNSSRRYNGDIFVDVTIRRPNPSPKQPIFICSVKIEGDLNHCKKRLRRAIRYGLREMMFHRLCLTGKVVSLSDMGAGESKNNAYQNWLDEGSPKEGQAFNELDYLHNMYIQSGMPLRNTRVFII